ncbi:MAG: cysteine desulfurase [Lachnospiraceae bacterium]|nr:cysteine desulfurase [Lachnospiraceae bacterium]
MKVYLDNAATTKPHIEVVEKMNYVLNEDYGNPSSKHIKGYDAEKYLKESRNIISKLMKVDSKEIYFTSGGTEANNLALIGAAMANKRRGMHIISTRIEHPSVYNPLLFLEELGYEIEFLEVDNMGHVSIEDLKGKLRQDTILVSTMFVNNEVGAVQDIAQIGQAIKDYDKDIVFHVDAIQGFGKYKIYPKRCNIDLMSVSGHKIHGPKGIGFLYIKDKTRIKTVFLGGGQEKGFRSGTENVPGIAGLGEATRLVYEEFDKNIETMYALKKHLIAGLLKIENVTINAVDMNQLDEEIIKKTAPHVVSASFEGIKSEVLLHSLEDKGVYVSSGSACSSNHPAISGTLKAIKVKDNLLDSTIRFSFASTTTIEDIDYTIQCLQELVPILRRYKRY